MSGGFPPRGHRETSVVSGGPREPMGLTSAAPGGVVAPRAKSTCRQAAPLAMKYVFEMVLGGEAVDIGDRRRTTAA